MILPVVGFLAALAIGWRWKGSGLRWLVALTIVLVPLRGGMLALARDSGIPDPGLAVNSLTPALIAAIAVGVVVWERPRLAELPRALLVGWCLIAATALINFPLQDVGLKLYGVGLAQYLVYPTLAIAAWPLCEPGDLRRVSRLFILMAGVVAVTVILQAAGVEGFIQSAAAQVEGLAANRYAGVTGSYLHTSSFLGAASVLVMGELLTLRGTRQMVLGSALLGLVLSGQILTFSRSGVVIAMIGLVALAALAAKGRRLGFAAMVVPAIALALAAGAFGGVAPDAAGQRVGSGFDPTGDQGNSLRSDAFGAGLERFRDTSLPHKVAGEGLGFTGNARKLVSGELFVVESYYIKLLVEGGLIGLLAVGSFLLWAMFHFAATLWRLRRPWVASVAAAGLGLSLYNVIYPVLETQILALTWWLLLALVLRYEADDAAAGGGSAAAGDRVEAVVDPPALAAAE